MFLFAFQPETGGQAAAPDLGRREEIGERQEPEPDQQQQDGEQPWDQLRIRQPGVRGGENGEGDQAAELSSSGLPLQSESRMLPSL